VFWSKTIVSSALIDLFYYVYSIIFRCHSLVRLQDRIAVGLDVLQFFTMTNWVFNSQKFQEVYASLTPNEKEM
jgi:hypothetical protein